MPKKITGHAASSPKPKAPGFRVIEFYAENVMGLKVVEFAPPPYEVIVGGENGNGKTSIFNAILFAIGGKDVIAEKPIRKGETSAYVRLGLGKKAVELLVERYFTDDGTTKLTLRPPKGSNLASPQAVLDGFFGALTFDPMAFNLMKPAERIESLKLLAGVDFSDLESEVKTKFDERRLVNREVTQLKGQLAGMKFHIDAPPKLIVFEDLTKKLQEIGQHNARVEMHTKRKETVEKTLNRIVTEIEDADAEILELEARLTELKDVKETLTNQKGEETARLDALQKISETLKPQDTAPVLKEMEEAETVNERVRDNQERAKVQKSLDQKIRESEVLSTRLGAINGEKEERLAAAKFPVPGLSFSDDDVLFKKIPYAQLSMSEQIKLSTSMAIAMNPELKVVMIRHGSLLGDDNLNLVIDIAQQKGYQIWIERVGKGPEAGIIIEAGEIVENRL